jgi:hypothetical protein
MLEASYYQEKLDQAETYLKEIVDISRDYLGLEELSDDFVYAQAGEVLEHIRKV